MSLKLTIPSALVLEAFAGGPILSSGTIAPARYLPKARRQRGYAALMALAAGFVLRTKAEGWKLFCERMNVPPFLLWERLPGFDRLRRALSLAEKAAFGNEEFVRWLNAVRRKGTPELTAVPLTVERTAGGAAEMFRQRVAWWGGE